jgi:hypothetical protein
VTIGRSERATLANRASARRARRDNATMSATPNATEENGATAGAAVIEAGAVADGVIRKKCVGRDRIRRANTSRLASARRR